MEKKYVCPWCGCEEMVKGVQWGYSNVMPDKVSVSFGQKLNHIICKKCGSLVRSYVENTEKLREIK